MQKRQVLVNFAKHVCSWSSLVEGDNARISPLAKSDRFSCERAFTEGDKPNGRANFYFLFT